MKVQVVSDIHLEFGSQHLLYQLQKCKADVIVIAGDLHTSKGIIPALELVYSYVQKHIVFICGNHEYYYSTKQYVDEQLQEHFEHHKYIHILNNSVWEYKNVVFIGSTGWWTTAAAKNVVHLMSDFTLIHDIIPNNYGLDWGWLAYNFFMKNLKQYDKRNIFGKNLTNKAIVCVSHNAPSLQSIGKDYKDDALNPCFVNAWQHMIQDYKPDLWVHGHTHDNKEYQVDDTLVVCNPFGYENHGINQEFDPLKIICLPDPLI